MKKLLYFLLLAFVLTTAGCGQKGKAADTSEDTSAERPTLTISAAVSLTDALEEMQKTFEQEHNVSLKFNLGSSGTLAQQIEHGAPADVFISANEEWMDKLDREDLILDGTRRNVTANRIVLITSKTQPAKFKKIEDITDEAGNIAIGNPDSVPAGKYAKQVLDHLNEWKDLQKNFIMAKDVRQVLTYTETGNADIGFVYASDAHISDQVKVLDTAKASMHDPIVYPGAVVKGSKNGKLAKAFMEELTSESGQKIFEKYGFTNVSN